MVSTTSVILILIPVVLILLLIFALKVVKRLVKIALWAAIVIILLSTALSIYRDVTDFDERNTLFFYERNAEPVSAFVSTTESKTPVNGLESLVTQYRRDPQSLYETHHKIIRIREQAFGDVEVTSDSGTLTRDELIDELNKGNADLFASAYDAHMGTAWFISNLKAGHIIVEPSSLAFRLAKLVPTAFVRGTA